MPQQILSSTYLLLFLQGNKVFYTLTGCFPLLINASLCLLLIKDVWITVINIFMPLLIVFHIFLTAALDRYEDLARFLWLIIFIVKIPSKWCIYLHTLSPRQSSAPDYRCNIVTESYHSRAVLSSLQPNFFSGPNLSRMTIKCSVSDSDRMLIDTDPTKVWCYIS